MVVIESDRVCFFDCDDTLIIWNPERYKKELNLTTVEIKGRAFGIHKRHVQKILDYKTMGFVVVVWSTSGYKWATEVVMALNLQSKVDYVSSKPHRIFDDVKEIKDTLKHGYLELE